MSDNDYVRLCNVSDVPEGRGKQIELPGYDEPFAVFNLGGQFYLTDDTCTHAMASLADGDIDDGAVYCPLHGGAFDIATGAPVEAPCTIALKTHEVIREGDELFGRIR